MSPINGYGDVKNGSYNYVDLMNSQTPNVLIEDVISLKLGEKTNKNKNFAITILEFDTVTIRYPRRET